MTYNKQLLLIIFLIVTVNFSIFAQSSNNKISIHGQATYIIQHKDAFSVPYSGENSLSPEKESQTSITSTVFLGFKATKNLSFFFNPEIAGGSGLSQVLGLAGATNGETFRIGSPDPKLYVARMYGQYMIPLSDKTTLQEDGVNQVKSLIPKKFIRITIGKVSLADFFDKNSYSHDPRSQFMNWALMSNGAWDYAANTRGYSPSVIFEYISPKIEVRYSFALPPKIANGSVMDWNIKKAGFQTLEISKPYNFTGKNGIINFTTFFNKAKMGSYLSAINNLEVNGIPNIDQSGSYTHHKFGFGFNLEQELTESIGIFSRVGWNDGKNETWAFTEIDQNFSLGLSLDGKKWKRPNDNIGMALAVSGISKPHQNYLANGGLGFMLGDGQLNYKHENITEAYYSFSLPKNQVFVTLDYQLINNPGYNADRKGPVSVFSLRTHLEF